ncbi:cyclic-phosphate processing receiver domain-containing protein [Salibacterium aidingense]|uniref:cyclic-phosphate processing receiver domain-containing protein n=1 Tax=Salibacterium aidingense TaxID=384933 RepID=UPI00047D0664|nr:cyclic-phosphate processing receiver domain-containing protein [Salibacterium aidingense]
MERRNIFLDDVRPGPEDHIVVKTAEECMLLLRDGEPVSHLSLDHDLGSKKTNGFDVVLYLLEHNLYPDHITIHSANAAAGKKMYQHLLEGKKSGSVPECVKVTHRPLPLTFS